MGLTAGIRVTRLAIPFKVAFKHASAERDHTSSIWVDLRMASGVAGCGESCPRPYVTGETTESAEAWIGQWGASAVAAARDLDALRAWMRAHTRELDAHPAAWCALELAILDALAREAGQTIEGLLGRPPLVGVFTYSAVIGDLPAPAFAAMASRYVQQGFTDFKIKLSGDAASDAEKLRTLAALGAGAPLTIRADANNLWPDAEAAIAALAVMPRVVGAVEEPIPAGRFDDLSRIGAAANVRIVLDESCTRAAHLARLPGQADQWVVNVRVSKMGGLLRSLDVVERARALGINVIVGAQVGETSLLTRAGLTVARAAGDRLLAQEGAFGTHLLERDVCDPPLMFGTAGRLAVADFPSLQAPGLRITTAWPDGFSDKRGGGE